MKKQCGFSKFLAGALVAGGLLLASLPAGMAHAGGVRLDDLNEVRTNFGQGLDEPDDAFLSGGGSGSTAASDVEWKYVPVRRW